MWFSRGAESLWKTRGGTDGTSSRTDREVVYLSWAGETSRSGQTQKGRDVVGWQGAGQRGHMSHRSGWSRQQAGSQPGPGAWVRAFSNACTCFHQLPSLIPTATTPHSHGSTCPPPTAPSSSSYVISDLTERTVFQSNNPSLSHILPPQPKYVI